MLYVDHAAAAGMSRMLKDEGACNGQLHNQLFNLFV